MSIELKTRGLYSLRRSPDSPKIPQENLSTLNFLDIQTHLLLSPITTGFISSIKVSMKSLLIVKTISMVILMILFLALEYSSSDFPNNATQKVSSRY